MPSYYVDVADRRVGISPATAVAGTIGKDEYPSSFPYARWTYQSQKYIEYWDWFTGAVWEEKTAGVDKEKNPLLRFPLQINLIKTAAMKHNYVLFGEVADGPEPMVPIRVNPKLTEDDEAPDPVIKKRARYAERFVNEVWMENNGRTLQLEGGLLCQAMGGVVFKATWDPFNMDLSHKIKVEMVRPEFFLPVWDSTDPDHLLEAFLIWRVPAREAQLKYGYDLTRLSSSSHPDFLLYIEHWTEQTITIILGGEPISMTAEVVNEDGELEEAAEITYDGVPNPFGFIPMVYVPRERAGEYYGIPIVTDLVGLAKEINARMADIGDVISESSHRQIFIKNASGTIRTRDLGGQGSAVDLGTNGPNAPEPAVETIDPPTIPASLAGYTDTLRSQFMRDGFLSAVADGEDEGSQRSALTLAFRMFPLTSKARSVRTYWTNALVKFARMILRIAICQEQDGITMDHLQGVDFSCDWSPMVIRDREQIVNEVVLMLTSKAMTPKSALEILSMVKDVNQEMADLREWLTFLTGLEAQGKAGAGQGPATQVQTPVADTGYNSR